MQASLSAAFGTSWLLLSAGPCLRVPGMAGCMQGRGRLRALVQGRGWVTEIAPQRAQAAFVAGWQPRHTQQPQLSTTESRSSSAHPGRAHRKSARLQRASRAGTA